jgi:hypothetical protein
MDRIRYGGDRRADIRHPRQSRMQVTPWIARDPHPYAVREAVICQAAAERAALIHFLLAASFRTLRRLAHPTKSADR